MSPGEIQFRCKTYLSRSYEYASFISGIDLDSPTNLNHKNLNENLFENLWVSVEEAQWLVGHLSKERPSYVHEVLKEAEAILRGELVLLGKNVKTGFPIAWKSDPVTGYQWPEQFHQQIDIFGGDQGRGDIKYVWELNRHHFLMILGKAYLLTSDERYAQWGLGAITHWIEVNRYLVGVNWTSALEVAVRLISWFWTCSFLQHSKAFSTEVRRKIYHSLFQHLSYIDRHCSYFFSPYNHLVGEAAALFMGGSVFSWMKEGKRWQEVGWSILEREVEHQFHRDGGTVEQAFGYHHFTLGFFLQAILLRRRLGLGIPPSLWAKIEKAFEFSMDMTRPDGLTPMVGDGDEGKSIEMGQPSAWDFRPFLSMGAVLFKRGDFKRIGGSFPSDAAWYVGKEGWLQYESCKEREPDHSSRSFPHSGYFIMRTHWDLDSHFLVFDCGEISAGLFSDDSASAAHGHADALSIEVSAFGHPVLLDPGFYTYNGEDSWHRYFRDTRAHNTVVIDGLSQARYRGRMKWSNVLTPRLYRWVNTKSFDFVEGSLDGHSKSGDGFEHRRSITFLKPNYWLVRDEFNGRDQHQIDRYFHFAMANHGLDSAGMGVEVKLSDQDSFMIIPIEKEGLSLDVYQDGGNPEDGWIAPGYGRKTRAPVVRFGVRAAFPSAFHTLLLPFQGERPEVQIRLSNVLDKGRETMGQVISIDLNSREDILFYRSGRGEGCFYKGWGTNARMACLSPGNHEGTPTCLIVGGSFLTENGRPWLRLDRAIDFASISFEGDAPHIELSEPAQIESIHPNPTVRVWADKP